MFNTQTPLGLPLCRTVTLTRLAKGKLEAGTWTPTTCVVTNPDDGDVSDVRKEMICICDVAFVEQADPLPSALLTVQPSSSRKPGPVTSAI